MLVKPLINLFAGEYDGGKFRGFLTKEAARKENAKKAEKVILEALEYYRGLHPEALETRNGVKVVKPSWKIADEDKARMEYQMKQLTLGGKTKEKAEGEPEEGN